MASFHTALNDRLASVIGRGGRGIDGWSLVAIAVAAILAAPIVVILAHVFVPAGDIWAHLAATVLPRYVFNTLWLFVGVGAGTLVIGVVQGASVINMADETRPRVVLGVESTGEPSLSFYDEGGQIVHQVP